MLAQFLSLFCLTQFSSCGLPDSEELLAAAFRHQQCRPGGLRAAGLWNHFQHVRPAGELPPGSGPDPDAGSRWVSEQIGFVLSFIGALLHPLTAASCFLSVSGRRTSDEHVGPLQAHRSDRRAHGSVPRPRPQLHEGHPVRQHQLRRLRVPEDRAGGPVHVRAGTVRNQGSKGSSPVPPAERGTGGAGPQHLRVFSQNHRRSSEPGNCSSRTGRRTSVLKT